MFQVWGRSVIAKINNVVMIKNKLPAADHSLRAFFIKGKRLTAEREILRMVWGTVPIYGKQNRTVLLQDHKAPRFCAERQELDEKKYN